MSGLITWLEKINDRDNKARAILRRSLAFEPGTHIPAFHYVEPFLQGYEDKGWHRKSHYLVAGLWALNWREDQPDPRIKLPVAVGRFDLEHRGNLNADERRKTTSTEMRFINLLDADDEQLPYRLRQMVALLKEQPINFQILLKDLLYWNRDDKSVQTAWGRDFYKTINFAEQTELETETEMETAE